jgi:hypothetical protein
MQQARFYISLSLMMLLTACSGGTVQDALGINAKAPDEFVVVKRAPLSVPPEFDLKPPAPGSSEYGRISTREQARSSVLGEASPHAAIVESVGSENLPSSAESTFLDKLKVNQADPDIRAKLSEDRTKKPDTSNAKTLLEILRTEEGEHPVVDAKREAERIRHNKDNNLPVNKGETPVIEPKDRGLLDILL